MEPGQAHVILMQLMRLFKTSKVKLAFYTLMGHFVRFTFSPALQLKYLISPPHGSNLMHLGMQAL